MDATFDTRTEDEELILDFYVYETTASKLDGILPRVERVIDAGGHKSQLVSVSYVQENPTVLNNASLTRFALHTLQQNRGVGASGQLLGRHRSSMMTSPTFNRKFRVCTFSWADQMTRKVSLQ